VIVCLLVVFISCKQDEDGRYNSWTVAGGTKEGIRYSTLRQIDTSNVQRLQAVWTYHSGDADTINNSQIQCNPIIIDTVMYVTSPQLKLLALHAATGKLIWSYNPWVTDAVNTPLQFVLNNNRGVTYWSDTKNDHRIFYTAGSHIHAIDALTGKRIASFGDDGKVDLHHGLGMESDEMFITATSPGIIFGDLLIMGSRVDEGPDAAPGHIRAYDVHTGKQQWIFHTIPQPGEFGYDTWEDSIAYRKIGGANSWAGFTLDEKRGILFAPTGSASFDFYGGKRKGSNLFANSLLALNAKTGKRIWHFQFVHHDMWDMDTPTPPALVTIAVNGRKIDAVAQPTKTGFIFLFERETGKPVYPVEERPVPDTGHVAGEKPWPTQPFPTRPQPFARQSFTVAAINPLIPDASRDTIRKKLQSYRTGRIFTPPSFEGTVIFPGFDGGAEWGGPSFDPSSGILYVNANEMPWVLTMVRNKKLPAENELYREAAKRLYGQHCMSCHGRNLEGSGNYPALLHLNKKYDQSAIRTILENGRRMMPAFKQLSEEEKNALVAFLSNDRRSLSKTFPPQPVDTFRTLPYSTTGYNRFKTAEGYPAIEPPWGTLNAIDLNTGTIKWKIPIGEFPELKAKGIPATGTENYGGPVTTAGGLVFIAATRDGMFRAFHKTTGKLLWEVQLPSPGFATPSIYMINGKQYIVIACGGGKLGTRSGDAYVAFALPDGD
jgi:quinoprotein glucose dehydrogenase